MNGWHIDTRCVQEGWKPGNGEPRVVPIVQSTTFRYESAEALGDLGRHMGVLGIQAQDRRVSRGFDGPD